MFYTKVVDKIKTHILCSITFFENCAVYEIMLKNKVEPEGPGMMSQYGARVAWSISKATCMHVPGHTHTHKCHIYCFSMATMICECTSVLHYMYIVCLV
jgi:hypothetical protein